MTEAIVNSVVKDAVPDILSAIPGIAKEFVGPICQTVTTVGCRNQIVLAEAIAKIGPELVQYSGEIATKLVDCAAVVAESNCRESELIVKAVLDDSTVSTQEKVALVEQWKDSQNERTVNLMNEARKVAKGTGIGFLIYTGINTIKEKGPEIVKSVTKAAVQSKKSGDRTRRSKEWAKTMRDIAKSVNKSKAQKRQYKK